MIFHIHLYKDNFEKNCILIVKYQSIFKTKFELIRTYGLLGDFN